MTQNDTENGRAMCVLGIAAVTPAEFVMFRIVETTSGVVSA